MPFGLKTIRWASARVSGARVLTALPHGKGTLRGGGDLWRGGRRWRRSRCPKSHEAPSKPKISTLWLWLRLTGFINIRGSTHGTLLGSRTEPRRLSRAACAED